MRKNSLNEQGKAWNREALGQAVHLTEDQLGRLERGERKYIDKQTLTLLADSFNLTKKERKEFYYAALGLQDREIFNQEVPETQLKNLMGPTWKEASLISILEFRGLSLRYRHTNYFTDLLNKLFTIKDFKRDWQASHCNNDYCDTAYTHFTYKHCFFGLLDYTVSKTKINTMAGELNYILHNPTNPGTLSVFEELAKYGGTKVLKLAPWPEKY